MKPVLIHTDTGKILSVDYWTFREVLQEAARQHCKYNDHKHAELCDTIIGHLIANQ